MQQDDKPKRGPKPKSGSGEVMKLRSMRWTDSGWEDAKIVGHDNIREWVRKQAKKMRPK